MWYDALCLFVVACATLNAQPRKVLYVTHSAGFRHDCIPGSAAVLERVASESGKLAITWTENASAIDAANLRNFDAVLFYTSGELPLSADQKRSLLDFVARGGGFAGVHSATDTLYSWPEYGELIGGYFDGHPWAQEVRIAVEDAAHPAVAHLAPGFRITDEIYQFRNLSRVRVRPLLSLDLTSVDPQAQGAHRDTTDFPLAWTRLQGEGRVFYTALGHFAETWNDARFQRLMLEALLWVTRQTEAAGEPRAPQQPAIDGVGNAASMQPLGVVAPSSIVSIYGRNLASGSATTVALNGTLLPVLYASPSQLNFVLPARVEGATASLRVSAAGLAAETSVNVAAATPAVFAVTREGPVVVLWATGIAAAQPRVRINGAPAKVLWFGMTQSWPGLYQINVEYTQDGPVQVELTVDPQ